MSQECTATCCHTGPTSPGLSSSPSGWVLLCTQPSLIAEWRQVNGDGGQEQNTPRRLHQKNDDCFFFWYPELNNPLLSCFLSVDLKDWHEPQTFITARALVGRLRSSDLRPLSDAPCRPSSALLLNKHTRPEACRGKVPLRMNLKVSNPEVSHLPVCVLWNCINPPWRRPIELSFNE